MNQNFIYELNLLKENVIKLNDEIKILKKEIYELKLFHLTKKDSNLIENKENNKINAIEISEIAKEKKDPNNLQLLYDITKDSYSDYIYDNSFTVFKSINNIYYLIYATKNKSIISYNLNLEKKATEIKKAHEKYITSFKYYYDKIRKREIIMSISSSNNNIKLWNIYNWECITNLDNINYIGEILSACILGYKNKNYIISSNYNLSNSEHIKVYNFKGKKISELNQSDEDTFYIDTFYDKKKYIYYIITCNSNYVKSYDFNNNRLYRRYYEYSNNNIHLNSNVYIDNNIIKLIESCEDGYIRIWNFHSGSILNRINIENKGLTSLCFWDNDYIIVGTENKYIKLIDLINGKIVKNLIGNKKQGITIKKLYSEKYGECLLTKGQYDDQIKIWIIK